MVSKVYWIAEAGHDAIFTAGGDLMPKVDDYKRECKALKPLLLRLSIEYRSHVRTEKRRKVEDNGQSRT